MRAPGSATASSAMSSAAACSSTSSTAPARMPAGAYRTVRDELAAYGHGLAEKPEIVALSKADALDEARLKEQAARLKRAAGRTPLILSAASGEGVEEALRALPQGGRCAGPRRAAIGRGCGAARKRSAVTGSDGLDRRLTSRLEA